MRTNWLGLGLVWLGVALVVFGVTFRLPKPKAATVSTNAVVFSNAIAHNAEAPLRYDSNKPLAFVDVSYRTDVHTNWVTVDELSGRRASDVWEFCKQRMFDRTIAGSIDVLLPYHKVQVQVGVTYSNRVAEIHLDEGTRDLEVSSVQLTNSPRRFLIIETYKMDGLTVSYSRTNVFEP